MTPKLHRKGNTFFIQVKRPAWVGDVLFRNLPNYVHVVTKARQVRIYGKTESECFANYRKFEMRGMNEAIRLKFLLTK